MNKVYDKLYSGLISSLKIKVRQIRFIRNALTVLCANNLFPAILGIDLTNNCNIKCSFCPTHNMGWEKGFISISMIEKIIAQFKKKIKIVVLHNFGEPLLHKDIEKIIVLLKNSGFAECVHFATNAILLNEQKSVQLIHSGLDSITLSVDALGPKEYLDLKGIDGLSIIKKNANDLMRLKKELKKTNPFVTVKMICTDDAKPETRKRFVEQWTENSDEIVFSDFFNWGGQIESKGRYPIPKKRYACHHLWTYPVISWNGDVYTCCATTSKASILGNINEQSFLDIWQGPQMRGIRQAHLRKQFDEIEGCRKCLYWAESQADLDFWFKMIKSKL